MKSLQSQPSQRLDITDVDQAEDIYEDLPDMVKEWEDIDEGHDDRWYCDYDLHKFGEKGNEGENGQEESKTKRSQVEEDKWL